MGRLAESMQRLDVKVLINALEAERRAHKLERMRLQTKTSELLTLELKYDRKLRECEDIEDRLRETELEAELELEETRRMALRGTAFAAEEIHQANIRQDEIELWGEQQEQRAHESEQRVKMNEYELTLLNGKLAVVEGEMEILRLTLTNVTQEKDCAQRELLNCAQREKDLLNCKQRADRLEEALEVSEDRVLNLQANNQTLEARVAELEQHTATRGRFTSGRSVDTDYCAEAHSPRRLRAAQAHNELERVMAEIHLDRQSMSPAERSPAPVILRPTTPKAATKKLSASSPTSQSQSKSRSAVPLQPVAVRPGMSDDRQRVEDLLMRCRQRRLDHVLESNNLDFQLDNALDGGTRKSTSCA